MHNDQIRLASGASLFIFWWTGLFMFFFHMWSPMHRTDYYTFWNLRWNAHFCWGYLTTTAGSTGGYVTLEYLTNDHIPWQCTLCSQTRSQVHCTFFLVEARNSLGNNQGLATAAGNPVHYCHWTFSQLQQNQIPKILQLFSVVWVPSLYAIQKMRLHSVWSFLSKLCWTFCFEHSHSDNLKLDPSRL